MLTAAALGLLQAGIVGLALEGFSRWDVRAIAIVPAVVVSILYGSRGTSKLLVLSQVILSLQLSFAVVPLVSFTSDRRKSLTRVHRKGRVFARNKMRAQQPSGLNGHADTFGHNGVRFTRCVPDREYSFVPERSNPRPDWPSRQPRALRRRVGQHFANSTAGRLNMRE